MYVHMFTCHDSSSHSFCMLREPGDVVVARSIEIGHPIIYVAMNHRLSGEKFADREVVLEDSFSFQLLAS